MLYCANITKSVKPTNCNPFSFPDNTRIFIKYNNHKLLINRTETPSSTQTPSFDPCVSLSGNDQSNLGRAPLQNVSSATATKMPGKRPTRPAHSRVELLKPRQRSRYGNAAFSQHFHVGLRQGVAHPRGILGKGYGGEGAMYGSAYGTLMPCVCA